MTENMDFNPYDFDYGAVEASQDFNANAKDGVYPLTLKKAEVGRGELNFEPSDSDTRPRANLFYTFAAPGEVEKIGTGLLQGIRETLWLHTAKAMSRLRSFVESHGGDWGLFSEQIRNGSGRDFVEVINELLQGFLGSDATARVTYVSSYKNKEGEIVALKKPRNEIAAFVVPSKKNA